MIIKNFIIVTSILLNISFASDIKNTLKSYKNACDNNNSKACIILGDLNYSFIYKEKRDTEVALPYYIKACNYGNLGGCKKVAKVYYNEIDLYSIDIDDNFKNLQLSFRYYKIACEADDIESCLKLTFYIFTIPMCLLIIYVIFGCILKPKTHCLE